MNIIEVNNITKSFDEVVAVDNISFSVEAGKIFAFLGPNGAGKTTTIKMLTTLLNPSSGSIMLNGYDSVKDADGTRHSFGIVFQDLSLDSDLTAFENMNFHAVLYGIKAPIYQKRIEELLKLVELWGRKNDLVKEFSGGMKRRLEIARGLLHHPKVLFLDEPTLGLDPQTRNKIWGYIKELNIKENLTVFFTTHYMEEADRVADIISVIDHGKIIASGTSEELKSHTKTDNLEDAFLALTGKNIRADENSGIEKQRQLNKLWGRH